MTEDGVPILSLMAINETTGKLAEQFNNPLLSGGPYSVTFCRACDTGPVGIQLPYDYTSLAFGLHAWDQLQQTLYFVLWNPAVGEQSKTLFGVSRVTSTAAGDVKYVSFVTVHHFCHYLSIKQPFCHCRIP